MDYKKLEKGDIPVYGTGGYMLSVDKALSYDKDAIGIGRKGTIDKPYILKAPFWTVDTLFYCIPKDNFNLDFLYGIFQKTNWKRKDESTGVPSLSKTNINSTVIAVPSIKEQKQIADLLTLLEKRIEKQHQLVEALKLYKRGAMQRIFHQSASTIGTPDWTIVCLGDIFKKVFRRNTNGEVKNVITNSAEYGLIPQREFFEKDIAVDGNTSNYYVIEQGDFVYNPRKSTTAPFGPFNRYELDEKGIISPLYTCLVLQTEINPIYLAWYFKSNAWHRYIYDNGSQGVRHDRVSMTDDLLMGIPVMIPDSAKQKLYADVLDKLEYRVHAAQTEYELLYKMKNGYLQQLFI